MASNIVLAPDIDERVALMIAPGVQRITDAVKSGAQRAAPATKDWHDMGDALVRPWHRDTSEGWQADVPANLRFPVPHSPRKGIQHYPGVEMLREPRDPTAYYLQTEYCRCFTSQDPQGIARTIDSRPVTVTGTVVAGQVVCSHPRGRESNYGTAEDVPAAFMEQGMADARSSV